MLVAFSLLACWCIFRVRQTRPASFPISITPAKVGVCLVRASLGRLEERPPPVSMAYPGCYRWISWSLTLSPPAGLHDWPFCVADDPTVLLSGPSAGLGLVGRSLWLTGVRCRDSSCFARLVSRINERTHLCGSIWIYVVGEFSQLAKYRLMWDPFDVFYSSQ